MVDKFDLVFLPDLIRIKRDILRDIAIDCSMDTRCSQVELAQRIWAKMRESEAVKKCVLQRIENIVFAGRTSITWYLCPRAKEVINAEAFRNEVVQPLDEEVTTSPMLVGAAPLNEERILLRFIARTGVLPQVFGFSISHRPKTELITVILSLSQGYIEVRAEPKLASKVIESFKELVLTDDTATITRVESFSNENMERWVDELNGRLVETLTHPEALIEDMDESQVQAILDVLYAIDEYFDTRNPDSLLESLDNLCQVAGDCSNVPFTALVLAGMNKIGLATTGPDLRDQALFSALRPHLTYLRGFIRYPVVEDGITNEYTIRIGISTKSVYFHSLATEQAIDRFREVLFKMENGVINQQV